MHRPRRSRRLSQRRGRVSGTAPYRPGADTTLVPGKPIGLTICQHLGSARHPTVTQVGDPSAIVAALDALTTKPMSNGCHARFPGALPALGTYELDFRYATGPDVVVNVLPQCRPSVNNGTGLEADDAPALVAMLKHVAVVPLAVHFRLTGGPIPTKRNASEPTATGRADHRHRCGWPGETRSDRHTRDRPFHRRARSLHRRVAVVLERKAARHRPSEHARTGRGALRRPVRRSTTVPTARRGSGTAACVPRAGSRRCPAGCLVRGSSRCRGSTPGWRPLWQSPSRGWRAAS